MYTCQGNKENIPFQAFHPQHSSSIGLCRTSKTSSIRNSFSPCLLLTWQDACMVLEDMSKNPFFVSIPFLWENKNRLQSKDCTNKTLCHSRSLNFNPVCFRDVLMYTRHGSKSKRCFQASDQNKQEANASLKGERNFSWREEGRC